MGRPLSRQQFFGANAKNNIKVQFNNGTASVPGYIVKQKGSKRFLCKDKDGNEALCSLVDKASADLLEGEMSITLKYDEGTVVHATKIARHRFTAFGEGVIFGAPWSFSTSTSDSVWQIEEAGTDLQLTDNTDLEGDDAPPFNLLADYPVPGSGNYLLPTFVVGQVTYEEIATPVEPSGSIPPVDTTSFANGLRRNKYLGNFGAPSTQPPSWNYTWFATNSNNIVANSQVSDTFGGFGSQSDTAGTGGSLFSLESIGWIKPPVSQNYNFYISADDYVVFWIGNDAKSGYNNTNAIVAGGNGLNDPIKTVYLDSNKWYPVRVWFTEFNGICLCQIFAKGANGAGYNGQDFSWKYNPQGEGW